MEENVFLPSRWFRLEYRIEEVCRGSNPFLIIAPKKDSDCWWYVPPLPPTEREAASQAAPWEKRPGRPDDWNIAPHLHLARINPDSPEEILGFVNKWGLLGLWRVERYCMDPGVEGKGYWPLRSSEEMAFFNALGVNWFMPWVPEEYSAWYRWDGGPTPLHRFCEPVSSFARAVRDYQAVLEACGTRDVADQDAECDLAFRFNRFLVGCAPQFVSGERKIGWVFPSLLHAIYLAAFLSVVQGNLCFKRCKNEKCRRLTLLPEIKEYCSTACKNAQTQRDYDRKTKKQAVPQEDGKHEV